MRSYRKFAAALIAFFIMAGPAPGADLELRVADTQTADYPTVRALEHMGLLLSQASQGRLELKVLHSRLMGEEAETIEYTRAGALDMARVNFAPLNALVPETVVPSLPFVFRSLEHLHHVFDGPIGDDIARAFERYGLIVLAYYDSGARSFYTVRTPIRVPADMKGLRIRVQQSPVSEAMIKALGAVPAPLPYGQVGIGLETGVIDGAENNWPSYRDSLHYRVAPYYSPTEHTMAPEVLVMSRKVWDTLSEEDKGLIRDAARQSALYMRDLWAEREKDARAALEQDGITVTDVDKPAFAAAMKKVYAHFAASPAQKRLLQRIRAVE